MGLYGSSRETGSTKYYSLKINFCTESGIVNLKEESIT
jgi:hypothetical protein